tara:strand:- start:30885 stop:32045 length:1161 start_codon:yes stop_codon:yes gene_type:complete
MNDYKIKWNLSIDEIDEASWFSLTGKRGNVFLSWKWLSALEKSNTITREKGWQSIHLTISKENKIIGLAPLYIKNHSYGEFIFDHNFQRLAYSLRLNYFPKIIGMSPFSPIEGYQFFISEDEDREIVNSLLINTIDNFAQTNNILSTNFLYADKEWAKEIKKLGYNEWINIQSEWSSHRINTFDDYLLQFNSNQRRNIKKERKSIEKESIKIQALSGRNIKESDMNNMFKFYEKHCDRWGDWGSKYLTQSFFKELSKDGLRDNVVLFCALQKDMESPIAMSLCIKDRNNLYGRYWGSSKEVDNLHFETCYYSPISWGLNNGIKLFDPGAGGSHKARRGFKAKSISSLHRWYEINMNAYLKDFMQKSNKIMIEEISARNAQLPFKID